jgi:AcrR family transcriptional regulator
MSPRPQTVSDADLLEGAARAISRLGVMRLTLANVAAELQVSPGTLVHRFGSKRGLLLRLMGRSVGRVAERLAATRAAHRSPYATLLALGDHMARYVQTPEALANHLAFLQVDLSDPEFHRLTFTHARAVRKEIRSLIRDAIKAGELTHCDADKLARAIQATMNGSLLQWAIDREGELAPWIRGNVATVLRPLARGRRRRRSP